MQNIKIAIQDSYIPDHYATALVEACQKLNVSYECFGLIPFSDIITGSIVDDTESIIIPFGSTKIIKIWLRNKLPQNWKIFYNADGFDFKTQIIKEVGFYPKELLGKYLLNANGGYILDFPACVDRTFALDMFVKPTSDLKLFNGQILYGKRSLRRLLEEQTTDSDIFNRHETVLFANIEKIYQEWRCFVISNRVVTISQYKENGELKKGKPDRYDKAKIEELTLKFQPCGYSRPYVVDIARTVGGEFKIVEYNALQCSGFYDCNVEDILIAIVEYAFINK